MLHMERARRPVPARRMWKHGAWVIVVVLTLVIAATIVLLVMGNLVDPASNILTFVSAGVGTTFGPHLVLLSLIALLVGVVGFRSGPRRLGTVTTVVAVVAFLASTLVTAQIVQAVDAAGGSANPISGLWLSSMTGASPDVRETYTAWVEIPNIWSSPVTPPVATSPLTSRIQRLWSGPIGVWRAGSHTQGGCCSVPRCRPTKRLRPWLSGTRF